MLTLAIAVAVLGYDFAPAVFTSVDDAEPQPTVGRIEWAGWLGALVFAATVTVLVSFWAHESLRPIRTWHELGMFTGGFGAAAAGAGVARSTCSYVVPSYVTTQRVLRFTGPPARRAAALRLAIAVAAMAGIVANVI